jgi:hypothetical protein
MDINNALDKTAFYGFIPRALDIRDMPELIKFPFNILFMRTKIEGGKIITGTALYEPEFHTHNKENQLSCMRYRNAYGGNSYVMMGYDKSKPSYCGKKFVNDKEVGMAEGPEWKMFFTHLTMLGISNGERCRFDEEDAEMTEKEGVMGDPE